ncbi:hypothetical protein FSP39_021093 [Pinctada imbricata]|uniref:Uncharacterized protein n=1 Tax=Pinctada imbricata TaxID=66713 RepID=A0AA88XGW7_PINIB|nr:hypothetical protein FSP39_021093 [Pinctada imbricata]
MHNMSVLLGSFIRIILYTNLPSYVESDDEKRILLNDQTTIPSLLHQYETQLNKYGIALQQVESKMAAMESKMTAIQTENAKIKRENENLNASVANLSGKNNNMNVSLEKLSTENNNLKSSLESLRTENNNITSSLAKLGTENEDMKVSLVNLRSENKIMNDRITTLQGINQSGIAGGSFYNEKGSGVNALCLPHNPDNGVSINSITSYAGLFATLYGAEYQYNYKNVRIDDDVPCAVVSREES